MSRRLEILRHLRQGGAGDILEAEERLEGDIRRTVVVKRLRPDRRETEERAFLDEARILAQLSHPGVVRLLGLERIDGDLVQVLERIDGRSLAEWVAAGRAAGSPLPLSSVLRIVTDLANTLDYVHSATNADGQPLAIVHRDLSPHNVFLARQGQVKLLDFGVARSTGRREQTQVGVAKGTEGFMSPEQLLDENVDPRSDLYALGLLMYFMLEGASPLTDPELQQRVLMGESLPPPSNCPAEWQPLLGRLLEPDPDRRPRDAAAVVRALWTIQSRSPQTDASELRNWLTRVASASTPIPAPANTHPLAGLFSLPFESEEQSRGQTRRFVNRDPTDAHAYDPTLITEATSETWSTEVSSTSVREPPEAPTRVEIAPNEDVLTKTTEERPASLIPFFGEASSRTWSRPELEVSWVPPPAGHGSRQRLLAGAATLAALCLVLVLVAVNRSTVKSSSVEGAVTDRETASTAGARDTAVRVITVESSAEPAALDVPDPLPRRREDLVDRAPRSREKRTAGPVRGPRGAPSDPLQPEPHPTEPLPSSKPTDELPALLERLARRLRSVTGKLPADELRSFEKAYLDLRLRLGERLDPAAQAELSEAIQSELARLARAVDGAAEP